MKQVDLFSELKLNKLHNFVRRTTKDNNAELFVCTDCGATKNSLNYNVRCKPREKPFSIESFLNAT